MRITNGQVDIEAADLNGLSVEEREALQRLAAQTNITLEEFFEGALTDLIARAVTRHLDIKIEASREISEAFVRADSATQDSIRALLGVVISPAVPSPIVSEIKP